MKLTGTIYDFGDEPIKTQLRSIADEIGERFTLNSTDGDDEAARGQDLRSFLYAIASTLETPEAVPIHEELNWLALRGKYLPDHLRKMLQDLARELRSEHEMRTNRLAGHEAELERFIQDPATCEQLRDDYGALVNRARNAITMENYAAADAFLLALDHVQADQC